MVGADGGRGAVAGGAYHLSSGVHANVTGGEEAGDLRLVELGAGEKYTVDTGHMVAFDESVSYDVGRAGSWKSTLLGGEGLVVKLSGPGRFYLQTRNPQSFLDWLVPKLPGKRQ